MRDLCQRVYPARHGPGAGLRPRRRRVGHTRHQPRHREVHHRPWPRRARPHAGGGVVTRTEDRLTDALHAAAASRVRADRLRPLTAPAGPRFPRSRTGRTCGSSRCRCPAGGRCCSIADGWVTGTAWRWPATRPGGTGSWPGTRTAGSAGARCTSWPRRAGTRSRTPGSSGPRSARGSNPDLGIPDNPILCHAEGQWLVRGTP
jgi:hypothetical protein